MALFNLRRVATATTGTGTITLGSAVTGFKAFSDTTAIPDQTWVTYAIADTANSEQGYGLYSSSGPTLTRNVVESTNSNNPINLSGSAQVFITPLAGDIQSDTAFPNRIRNGGMDIFQKGTGTLTITTGLAVTNAGGTTVSSAGYTADGWIVVPTGASVTSNRGTGRLGLTQNALQVTGNTSVTDIIIKQRIEGAIAAALTSQPVIFQAWVYQSTGGSITPTLTVKHANSVDNWGASTTDVNAVSLQACPNTTWTQVIYVFTSSASSTNGLEISLDFGNNFSTNAKTVLLTEVDLRAAPGYPTGLAQIAPEAQLRPVHEELVFCQRYYSKSVSQATDIGTNVGNGSGAELLQFSSTVTGMSITARYPQTMRAVPTFTVYDNAGNVNKVSTYQSGVGWTNNTTSPTTAGSTDRSINVIAASAPSGMSFDWTASAEL